AADDQRIQGPNRKRGGNFMQLGITRVVQEHHQALAQVHEYKSRILPGGEEKLPLLAVQIHNTGFEQVDGDARKVRVVVGVIHHNLGRFAFQLDLGDTV